MRFSTGVVIAGSSDEAVFDPARNSALALASESFAARFRVGRGDTLRVPTPAGPQMLTLAGIYADYGNERGSLLVERTHLVGHDWGGIVAWGVAMEHPERIDRLVILNQTHPGRMYEAIRTLRQAKMSWYVGLFQVPWLPEFFASRRRCASS